MSSEATYLQFTKRQNLDKFVHSFEGVLHGIIADGDIGPAEVQSLRRWLEALGSKRKSAAFREVADLVEKVIEDGVVDAEELEDLRWLVDRWTTSNIYYDAITADLQRLHGMIVGFLADGELSDGEIRALSDWLADRAYLIGTWPYDELNAALVHVLQDGVVTEEERAALKDFLAAHVPRNDRAVVDLRGMDLRSLSIDGVCAANVEILIPGRKFCFTGKSSRMQRDGIHRLIEQVGGLACDTVVRDLHYLIVGAEGNPCWAFAAYGRKVEKAMKLRRDEGAKLLIIHETDFWDAVADYA